MTMFRDYTVSGVITEAGRLELTDRRAFMRAMRAFQRGKVTVRVEVSREKRSTYANRYYRLILGLISDETGDEVDELHEYFKRRFLDPRVVRVLGQDVTIWTTADKDREAFYQYVERIRRFALIDLGVETPDPDPALRGHARHAKRKAA